MERYIPDLHSDDSECCGCSACYAVCPCDAIAMEPDRYGFLYPQIDQARCICCGKCLSVCVFKKKLGVMSEMTTKQYAPSC